MYLYEDARGNILADLKNIFIKMNTPRQEFKYASAWRSNLPECIEICDFK